MARPPLPYAATAADIRRAKESQCPDFCHAAGAADAAAGFPRDPYRCGATLRPANPGLTLGEMLAYGAGFKGESL